MRKLLTISGIIVAMFFISCADEPFNPAETDIRTEISKTWNVDENNGESTFECVISKDPTDAAKVQITNFHKMASVKATVYDDKTIVIANANLTETTQLKNCTGTISGTFQKIEWTYTISDQDGDFQVSAVFVPGTISKKKKIQ